MCQILEVGVETAGLIDHSYILEAAHTFLIDVVQDQQCAIWLDQIDQCPDYLILTHVSEKNHASLKAVMEKYPEMQVLSIQPILDAYDIVGKAIEDEYVFEDLNFKYISDDILMVYDQKSHTLFSSLIFSTPSNYCLDDLRSSYLFKLNLDEICACRLKTHLDELPIQRVCVKYGQILMEDVFEASCFYRLWSQRLPEQSAVLAIKATFNPEFDVLLEEMKGMMVKHCDELVIMDLNEDTMEEAVCQAWRYDRLLLCVDQNEQHQAWMCAFIERCETHHLQKKVLAFIYDKENCLVSHLSNIQNIDLYDPCSIQSLMASRPCFEELVDDLMGCSYEEENCSCEDGCCCCGD